MEDSKKLPTIEVGDASHTVKIDDTFCEYTFKFNSSHFAIDDFINAIEKGLGVNHVQKKLSRSFTSEVIKPTKVRVYSEEEVRKAIRMARQLKHVKHPTFYTDNEIIESLNK
jgi:hypothetical protein